MLTLASAWMKLEENVLRETPQTPWDSRTGGQREGPGAVSPTLGPGDTRRRRARGRGCVSATTRCSGFNKTEFLSYAGVCTRAPGPTWRPVRGQSPFLSGCDCALEPALRPAGTSSPPPALSSLLGSRGDQGAADVVPSHVRPRERAGPFLAARPCFLACLELA